MPEQTPSHLSLVTGIVVNWNGADDCIGLLESLATDFENGLRLVLVDNGSIDDSIERLRHFLGTWAFGSQVELIQTGENLGFTGGVNAGAGRALSSAVPPKYLLSVNPDGTMPTGTLSRLVSVADDSEAGIVCSTSEAAVLDAWPRFFYARPRGLIFKGEPPIPGRWREAGSYTGACVLFRAELVERLIAADGFFLDPQLFMYWDEWDVSLRARRLGARIVAAADAMFEHRRAGAPVFDGNPFRDYYSARNGVLLARRELRWWQFWPALFVHLGRDLSWRVRLRARGLRPPWRAYFEGTWDGVRRRGGRWKRHPARVPPE